MKDTYSKLCNIRMPECPQQVLKPAKNNYSFQSPVSDLRSLTESALFLIKKIKPNITMTYSKYFSGLALLGTLFFFSACKDDTDPVVEDTPEQITTVRLTFAPAGGGAPLVFASTDADGDGPGSVQHDTIKLQPGTTYSLSLEVLNELATPTENTTAEVENEAEEHMFFFGWTGNLFSDPTGNGNIDNRADAVNYGTTRDGKSLDANGLPVGLTTTWTTGAVATGTFKIILKHQPDIKSATSGVSDGESDLDRTLPVVVQ